MEMDPTRARAEVESSRTVLARFAHYLSSQQTVVTEQWLLAVRRDPKIATADRLTHHELLDHLPQLYAGLCEFLRKRDASTLVEEVKDGAEHHGEFRWRDGYRIDELLRELESFRHIVNGCITRYAQQDPAFRGAVEASASALVHQFFSEVEINSARQYATEQAALVHAWTEKLEAANVQLGRANATLKQVLTERQRLTTVVAHELRNFLQGLGQSARIWEQQDAAPSSARVEVSAHIRDMQAMLTQLLEHSELITGKKTPERNAFDPAVLHAELVETYQPLAQARGLALVADSSAAPREVLGDRARIRQVAVNLLANAVKYTHEGEVTFVFAVHDEQRWAICIADTGPGLTSRATGRLFGELTGDDSSPPGRGMGLGITRDLVELLGGSMQVQTRAGAGTRIEVLLPRLSAAEQTAG